MKYNVKKTFNVFHTFNSQDILLNAPPVVPLCPFSVLNSLNIFFGPSKKKFILVTYTKLDKHILHCLNLVCQPPGATGSDAFDALPPKFEAIFDQVADFFQLMDFL